MVEALIFLGLFIPLPFMVLNWRWAIRHEKYWDVVRQREKERRAEKKANRDN